MWRLIELDIRRLVLYRFLRLSRVDTRAPIRQFAIERPMRMKSFRKLLPRHQLLIFKISDPFKHFSPRFSCVHHQVLLHEFVVLSLGTTEKLLVVDLLPA